MPNFVDAQKFHALCPWLFEYDGPDGRYAIVLHGNNPAQIIEDFCADLPGLTLLGEHGGTVYAKKEGGE